MEVACERLRAKHTARSTSDADLDLYVPPLCSPSKDTPASDIAVKDLSDAVTAWLASDSQHVLLLHGQSGSGKSLYVLYRRNNMLARVSSCKPRVGRSVTLLRRK